MSQQASKFEQINICFGASRDQGTSSLFSLFGISTHCDTTRVANTLECARPRLRTFLRVKSESNSMIWMVEVNKYRSSMMRWAHWSTGSVWHGWELIDLAKNLRICSVPSCDHDVNCCLNLIRRPMLSEQPGLISWHFSSTTNSTRVWDAPFLSKTWAPKPGVCLVRGYEITIISWWPGTRKSGLILGASFLGCDQKTEWIRQMLLSASPNKVDMVFVFFFSRAQNISVVCIVHHLWGPGRCCGGSGQFESSGQFQQRSRGRERIASGQSQPRGVGAAPAGSKGFSAGKLQSSDRRAAAQPPREHQSEGFWCQLDVHQRGPVEPQPLLDQGKCSTVLWSASPHARLSCRAGCLGPPDMKKLDWETKITLCTVANKVIKAFCAQVSCEGHQWSKPNVLDNEIPPCQDDTENLWVHICLSKILWHWKICLQDEEWL